MMIKCISRNTRKEGIWNERVHLKIGVNPLMKKWDDLSVGNKKKKVEDKNNINGSTYQKIILIEVVQLRKYERVWHWIK